MKPGGMLEADLEFRRNRPFATELKNREAVVQLQQSISLSGRQQRSVCSAPKDRPRNRCYSVAVVADRNETSPKPS